MKIVVFADVGPFWMPLRVTQLLQEATGKYHVGEFRIDRANPVFVKAVVDAGKYAGALRIVEIPDGVDWLIERVGCKEQVGEKHRIWRAEL